MAASSKWPARRGGGRPRLVGSQRRARADRGCHGAPAPRWSTFLVLTGLTPSFRPTTSSSDLLAVNAAAVFLLLGIIALEVWLIFQARRRGRAAARLHVRIVALFSGHCGRAGHSGGHGRKRHARSRPRPLFSRPHRAVIENSRAGRRGLCARARQHHPRSTSSPWPSTFARAKPLFDQDRERLRQFFTAQARVRGFASRDDPRATGRDRRATGGTQATRNSSAGRAGLAMVSDTDRRSLCSRTTNSVVGVIKLRTVTTIRSSMSSRPLDPRVVAQLRATQESVCDIPASTARRFGVQVAFALMYTVIALIVLLSAVWIGLDFANRLVAPIRRLIGAAKVVSTGNLYVQVPIRALRRRSRPSRRDLQQDDARTAHPARRHRARARPHRQRRRFTEAVLAGVSAGVIGVDADGRDQHPQPLGARSSSDARRPTCSASRWRDIVPELAEILANARPASQRLAQGQITINRNGRERNLRCGSPPSSRGEAERLRRHARRHHRAGIGAAHAAWADVARRIAHEIKNPLTPIQLSAERLRRKYGKRDHRGPRRLRPMHRHHHPPGRRHRAHGGRVLALRPHAGAGDRGRRRGRDGARRRCS